MLIIIGKLFPIISVAISSDPGSEYVPITKGAVGAQARRRPVSSQAWWRDCRRRVRFGRSSPGCGARRSGSADRVFGRPMEISEMVMASTGQETMARIVFCWEKGILFFPACRLSSR